MRGRRQRSSRPARFFPESASQQLIPLFELLSVGDICALACCSSGWSAALDAWRSTEVDIGDALHRLDSSTGLTAARKNVKTVARKYPRLQSLRIGPYIDLNTPTLKLLARCTMLRSVDFGRIQGPALVRLAQAAQQLRVVRVGDGLTAPSLVALAQACPNLEELTCTIMYDYEVEEVRVHPAPVRDAGVLALAAACPALRRLDLGGSGYEISAAAVIDLVSTCQLLVYLRLGNAISRATKEQLSQIRPALYIEDFYLTIKVVSQDGTETFFKCKKNTPLRRLMNAYCQRWVINLNAVRFFFDGERIRETQTPEDLDMEDCDAIDVLFGFQ